jgi:hypothetical protein
MTKKVDTDPNFPSAPSSTTEPEIDDLLADLGKPKPLDHKEKRSSSAGIDAAEYQAQPRVPPQRADHNTFPNAPVIVHQTNPGVAPPANPLNVTPEERRRLEEELEERRKAREHAERDAETAPRRTDPTGVSSDPPRPPMSLPIFAVLLLVVVAAVIIGVAIRAKSTSSNATSSSTSATTTPSATQTSVPIVPTTIETAPSNVTTATATATQTTHVVSTATTRPTATHTSIAPTVTATATTTTTSTSTGAPPDIRGSN